MTPEPEIDVGSFFDSLADGYTTTIERCFPRYREMLWSVLDYLPRANSYRRILELGCGTGNLSSLLIERFPKSEIVLVDISADSIDACRERFAGDRLECRQADFRDLEFAGSEFDLVVSSISVHHLDAAEKQRLFSRVHGWLNESGVFAYADQHAGDTDETTEHHHRNWKSLSMAAGSTEEEWEMWMKHQAEHDHLDTLLSQIDWLRQCGFSSVDCTWRYLLWATLLCQK